MASSPEQHGMNLSLKIMVEYFSEMQVPPLFCDIPAAVYLLILSISLMLSFVSAPF